MQTSGIAGLRFIQNISLLKSANEQPKLAGELIRKTVETLQNQNVQTPVSPTVEKTPTTDKGKIINIVI